MSSSLSIWDLAHQDDKAKGNLLRILWLLELLDLEAKNQGCTYCRELVDQIEACFYE